MRRTLVERRAHGRCEYCRAPQVASAYTFHVEHVVPRCRGGVDHPDNGALSCWSCNSAKAGHLTGTDPETSREEPLFHPRRDAWAEHFELSGDDGGLRVLGKTPVGRATVARLRMNDPRFQPRARRLWRLAGLWPPEKASP